MNTIIRLFSIINFLVLFSCSSSDDYLNSLSGFEGDHEEPARVILEFENRITKEVTAFVYDMVEESENVQITPVKLSEGIYNVEIKLFSAIGNELDEEVFDHDKEDHFVYYSRLENSPINIVYAEDDVKDSKGNKIGKKTIWTLEKNTEGLQIVYLIHQPGVKDPFALSADQLGGEIDIESKFFVTVE